MMQTPLFLTSPLHPLPQSLSKTPLCPFPNHCSSQLPITLPTPKMTISTSKPLTTTPQLTTPQTLLQKTKTFIFDCDGVIWRGDTIIPQVSETLDYLRSQNKRLIFVTNNSTKSRAQYAKKFASLNLEATPNEIFSSSFAAAAYLDSIGFQKRGKKVYVIGEKGIGEELDIVGIDWMGGEGDKDVVADMGKGGFVEHDKDIGAVVVGFDRNLNYYKIQYAQLCINENEGCLFVATNLDEVTHLTDCQEWAGNGAMVGAVKGCTGKEPVLVGKPSPLMIDYIVEKFGGERNEICMVGDRLDTDILFGIDNGLSSVLALTGVTTMKKLNSKENDIRPDYFVDSIADFLP